MSDGPAPIPEPRGALVPPHRRPPTAVGVATPPPPRPLRPIPHDAGQPWLRRTLGRAIGAALDVADGVGDAIRDAAGLNVRGRRRPPPDAPA